MLWNQSDPIKRSRLYIYMVSQSFATIFIVQYLSLTIYQNRSQRLKNRSNVDTKPTLSHKRVAARARITRVSAYYRERPQITFVQEDTD